MEREKLKALTKQFDVVGGQQNFWVFPFVNDSVNVQQITLKIDDPDAYLFENRQQELKWVSEFSEQNHWVISQKA